MFLSVIWGSQMACEGYNFPSLSGSFWFLHRCISFKRTWMSMNIKKLSLLSLYLSSLRKYCIFIAARISVRPWEETIKHVQSTAADACELLLFSSLFPMKKNDKTFHQLRLMKENCVCCRCCDLAYNLAHVKIQQWIACDPFSWDGFVKGMGYSSKNETSVVINSFSCLSLTVWLFSHKRRILKASRSGFLIQQWLYHCLKVKKHTSNIKLVHMTHVLYMKAYSSFVQ